MNAKEISDATLESVTPADNDLMLIYDTSEGTTGKATIADIAPKVAENIDISTLPAVTPAADDVLMIGDTSAGTTGKATLDILKAFFYQPVIIDYTINTGTVLEGMVYRIGNLVIINISISFSTIKDYTKVLENLPSPNSYVVNFSFTIARSGAELFSACGFITNDYLSVRLLGGISSGTAYISVSYVCK